MQDDRSRRRTGPKPKPLAERFWVKVQRSPDPVGCWLWTAYRNDRGYGQIRVGGAVGRAGLAHRVAYALTFGAFPEGLHVLHRCDTPACVNPAHLYLGDDATNHADMVARGRSTARERNPGARLTQAQVDAIRAAWARGGVTQRALGARFGVSGACVSLIVNRHLWP